MATHTHWSREQSILAMQLYMRTPFGRLHARNPEIIQLAKEINRTPGAVAMRCSNLASLDPSLQARGIKGLSRRSNLDKALWKVYSVDVGQLEIDAIDARDRLGVPPKPTDSRIEPDVGLADVQRQDTHMHTERIQLQRVRVVQGAFRRAVLVAYDNHCAFCGIPRAELLTASHIIPWSENVERRADPTNGLCLCALHDRAFDRCLMGVEPDNGSVLRIVVSSRLKEDDDIAALPIARRMLTEMHGEKLIQPHRFEPDVSALAQHLLHVA